MSAQEAVRLVLFSPISLITHGNHLPLLVTPGVVSVFLADTC